jgi:hypothetical protein
MSLGSVRQLYVAVEECNVRLNTVDKEKPCKCPCTEQCGKDKDTLKQEIMDEYKKRVNAFVEAIQQPLLAAQVELAVDSLSLE